MSIDALGILTLDDPDHSPKPPADTFNFSDWFEFPVIEYKVPGAYARDVVGGTRDLTDTYVQSARALQEMGVRAITADCGFTIVYQEVVKDAVSVPVACSSLQQLSLLQHLVPSGRRLGILTFDKPRLTQHHLELGGLVGDEISVGIEGIENTTAWQNWIADTIMTDWRDYDREVLAAGDRLFARHRDISHLLLECHGYPRCAPALRRRHKVPVYDWRSLCLQLMETAP